jgi:hypothetical protein
MQPLPIYILIIGISESPEHQSGQLSFGIGCIMQALNGNKRLNKEIAHYSKIDIVHPGSSRKPKWARIEDDSI